MCKCRAHITNFNKIYLSVVSDLSFNYYTDKFLNYPNSMFLGNPYVIFLSILIIVVYFEYDFLAKDHTICDVEDDRREYAELFCMARPQYLKSSGEGVYLNNYGRWQFYIIIQMFIGAVLCKTNINIGKLRLEPTPTIGKRYILTICILMGLIACWTLSFFSMGGYFNTFITRVLRHAVDRNGLVSPVSDVFPTAAECTVHPRNTNETFTTNCILPLNFRAPYYFIALFAIYVCGLLWTGERLWELAQEKIAETRCCLRSKQFVATISEDVKNQEDQGKTNESIFEELFRNVSLKVKHWTNPHTISSSQRTPLISEKV